MKIWLAEFIGTFALVFAGIGSIAAGNEGLAVALTFGLTVAVMISAVGGISFAHFNPAVTVGFLVLGRITFVQLLLYWSAELLGAVVAMFALQVFYGTERLSAVAYGATQLAPDISPFVAVGIEAVLTFFLFFVIATCVIQQHPQPGLYIGFTVTLCALAGGALTGASLNPARSFAPALISNIWTYHWVYWLGPIVGAIVAAFTARFLWQHKDIS
jgi:aquaporin TIP